MNRILVSRIVHADFRARDDYPSAVEGLFGRSGAGRPSVKVGKDAHPTFQLSPDAGHGRRLDHRTSV